MSGPVHDGYGPRDVVGYGKEPPQVRWPGGARIAVSLVLNYEEGAERSPVYGDDRREVRAELESGRPENVRDPFIETQWEYGSRAGIWRLLRILKEEGVRATFFASAKAFEVNPAVAGEVAAQGHAIDGHGYRWGDQWHLDRAAEQKEIRTAVEIIRRTTGKRPTGWFAKGGRSPNTRDLLVEEGFLYDSDELNDDLPYYVTASGKPWLVVPYAMDTNDWKFWRGGSWSEGEQFFRYLRDSFDLLYEEGETAPKMMSVGLHSRMAGRPGRALAFRSFIRYAKQQPKVWFAGRDEIAAWWREHHPPERSR